MSTAVSIHGLCGKCWSEASIETIEDATERALSVVVPGGRLEPMATVRW